MFKDKDFDILRILLSGKEIRFKDLEAEHILAKAALSKHLKDLRNEGLIRKKMGKKHDCLAYVITPKGKKVYCDKFPTSRLDEF